MAEDRSSICKIRSGIKSERPFRFRVSGILPLFLIAEDKFCRQFQQRDQLPTRSFSNRNSKIENRD
jgi:hypothetical protein